MEPEFDLEMNPGPTRSMFKHMGAKGKGHGTGHGEHTPEEDVPPPGAAQHSDLGPCSSSYHAPDPSELKQGPGTNTDEQPQ